MAFTKDELKALGWRDVKEHAESLGYFHKPENAGWLDDEVLDAIIALELQAESGPEIETSQPEPDMSEQGKPKEYVVQGKYATETFIKRGIPYCKKCGSSFNNAPDGSPRCPENFPAGVCPRLVVEDAAPAAPQEDFFDL